MQSQSVIQLKTFKSGEIDIIYRAFESGKRTKINNRWRETVPDRGHTLHKEIY